jgi:hypothetical protein
VFSDGKLPSRVSVSKVLFLDFDGVLGPGHFVFSYDDNLGRRAKREVRRVIDTTDCYVVISSTWRLGAYYEDLADILEDCGVIPHVGRVIGETPSLYGEERGDEIKAWLEDNSWVEEFAIVDDKDYAIKCTRQRFVGGKFKNRVWERKTYFDKKLERRFVQPKPFLGVTKENADDLIRILRGKKIKRKQ